ncbi:MAG: tRNA pseudouridine(55) synthase TruB [bacterium]
MRPSDGIGEHGPHDSDEPFAPNGFIVLDKPPGPTSYDCIRFLRRTCRIPSDIKIGHLGTLDPFACGVILIALGKAVKFAEFALHRKKAYRARVYLGEETDTLDPTGKVISAASIPPDWSSRLDEIKARFTGEIEQMPPVFSAKQVDGKRSYKAARKGESIELKPSKVTVYSLEILSFDENLFDFTCEVSGGTYVRSLARDMAKELGTVGHLVGLERTAVGEFDSDLSIPFSAFEVGGRHVLLHHLRPPDQLLGHLPSCTVGPESEHKIPHGQKLSRDDIEKDWPDEKNAPEIIRLNDRNGKFLSLGKINPSGKPLLIIPFKRVDD